jgi:hypothetical protein
MEHLDLEAIGGLLGLREILHLDKGVLQKTVGETLPPKKAGQIMMSIKIELQPKEPKSAPANNTAPNLQE